MRDRMTRRNASTSIMAEIKRLENKLAVDDMELEDWTDELETEEADIAEESTGYTVDIGEDQNDKSMDNWPTEASIDDDLEKEADDIAKEEVDIAEESTGIKVEEGTNQNDKAMKNWPIAKRAAVASRLVKLAKLLLED